MQSTQKLQNSLDLITPGSVIKVEAGVGPETEKAGGPWWWMNTTPE